MHKPLVLNEGFFYIVVMKKLLLLSLLFIGCGPSGPMPSDIPLLELPTDEMLENWANKIDSVFAPENFKEFSSVGQLKERVSSDFYDALKIKYQDLTWQSFYDLYVDVYVDSTYFNSENLNKYDNIQDYLKATHSRLSEFVQEVGESL